MKKIIYVSYLFALTLLPTEYVSSAPSDDRNLENLAQNPKYNEQTNEQITKEEEIKLDLHEVENNNNAASSGQRKKRWFNFHGYGFPPINQVLYPTNADLSAAVGLSGSYEDPFTQIYRRLQDVTNYSRQQTTTSPSLPYFPFFFPVLIVPSAGCVCSAHNAPTPTQPSPGKDNSTMPSSIDGRFPDIERNQNWGVVQSSRPPMKDVDFDEDGRRPVSFNAIDSTVPQKPPPPVDHGSSQAKANDELVPQSSSLSFVSASANTARSVASPTVTTDSSTSGARPSACDGAVLNCCHQLKVTYECFVKQGCPDPTPYQNPCEPSAILQVIYRFQQFYGQTT